ncbi:unnamed protein product [marine sediment metagenome]|uniref:Metanogen output domain-containing protein n=1 Tax=marine sediment metagenome TaxID=412755 RepID=X1NHB7_9ZZZZ
MSQEELTGKKEELASIYIKEILKNTFEGISQLNEEAADTVLKSTCRGCVARMLSFMAHNYGYDPEKPDLDAFMAAEEKIQNLMFPGQSSLTREGNIITAIVKAGECVCPLVKDYKIVQPSPNLCLCGKNAMAVVHEAATKRPVKVELIESYIRGGNCCHFRAELL